MTAGTVTRATDADFDEVVLRSGQPVMVSFGSARSEPCQALAPVTAELAAAHADEIKVVTMDIDDNPSTPSRYGVTAVPTLMFFRNGRVRHHIPGGDRDKIEVAMVLAIAA